MLYYFLLRTKNPLVLLYLLGSSPLFKLSFRVHLLKIVIIFYFLLFLGFRPIILVPKIPPKLVTKQLTSMLSKAKDNSQFSFYMNFKHHMIVTQSFLFLKHLTAGKPCSFYFSSTHWLFLLSLFHF